jgi:hypothetical protein
MNYIRSTLSGFCVFMVLFFDTSFSICCLAVGIPPHGQLLAHPTFPSLEVRLD